MNAFERAQRRTNQLRVKNGYKEQVIKCCQLCKSSSRMSVEEDLRCSYLIDDNWVVDTVNNLDICNLFNAK